MKSNKIEHWDEKKELIKEAYPSLTNEDLLYEIGKEEELLNRLEIKLKKNKQEIRKWLSLMG